MTPFALLALPWILTVLSIGNSLSLYYWGVVKDYASPSLLSVCCLVGIILNVGCLIISFCVFRNRPGEQRKLKWIFVAPLLCFLAFVPVLLFSISALIVRNNGL
jgi:hypothetical protein